MFVLYCSTLGSQDKRTDSEIFPLARQFETLPRRPIEHPRQRHGLVATSGPRLGVAECMRDTRQRLLNQQSRHPSVLPQIRRPQP